MSGVRVLVGTRKGAFILTSDGKRDKWDVSGPHFGGWEIYHLKGSPVDPDRIYASQTSGWFGQVMQRSDDGGKTLGDGGKQISCTTECPGTHQWYDGTQHPWEFKRVWHLEPSLTDAETRCTQAWRMRRCSSRPTAERAGTELSGLRGHGTGSALAAGRGRYVPAHDPARSEETGADFHCDLGGGGVPHRRWRQDLEADQQGAGVAIHSRIPTAEVGHCVHRIAMHPSKPDTLFMQKHWDVMRTDDAGDHWTKSAATCRRISDLRSMCTRTSRRRFTWCRSRATRSIFRWTGSCACIAAERRQRMGGAYERSAAEGLLRERAARCDGGGLAGQVRRVFRHHGRAGVLLAGWRRYLEADRARFAGGAFGRGADAAMRVRRSACEWCCRTHLRTLARVRERSELEVAGPVTVRSGAGCAGGAVSDAAGHDSRPETQQRRPFLRFFACEEDLSHESPDAELPEAVAEGKEPLLIVGAIAGG